MILPEPHDDYLIAGNNHSDNGASMTRQVCRKCMNYQKSLDPYGCFKQHATTDFFGQLKLWIFGCEKYWNPYWIDS
jgi:hypothetical protein